MGRPPRSCFGKNKGVREGAISVATPTFIKGWPPESEVLSIPSSEKTKASATTHWSESRLLACIFCTLTVRIKWLAGSFAQRKNTGSMVDAGNPHHLPRRQLPHTFEPIETPIGSSADYDQRALGAARAGRRDRHVSSSAFAAHLSVAFR